MNARMIELEPSSHPLLFPNRREYEKKVIAIVEQSWVNTDGDADEAASTGRTTRS